MKLDVDQPSWSGAVDTPLQSIDTTLDALQLIHEEHAAVAAMMRSLSMLVERGPGDKPQRFFEVMRAMLFYIDDVSRTRSSP